MLFFRTAALFANYFRVAIRQSLCGLLLVIAMLIPGQGLMAQALGKGQVHSKVFTKLEQFKRDLVQEKVFLHIDRNFYFQGQTIWFKAYVITEPFSTLDTLSGNLYVELVNAQSGIVERQTIYLDTGLGNGSIDIPEDINSGLYYLRAYTNWMRNFDSDFYFKQPIEISNANDKAALEPKNQISQPPALSFFPEGGELVSGLVSRLAFKAVNQEGRGVSVNGVIYNSADDTVAHFQSSHLGMGFFNFKPEPQQYYYARIAGVDKSYDLPAILDQGYTFRVNNSFENVISISISKSAGQQGGKPFLMVQADGQAYSYVSGINFDNRGEALISMPKKDLPEGLAQVTLFNDKGMPERERLVFIHKENGLISQLSVPKDQFKHREKVALELSVKNADGSPVQGSFSLAVIDEAYRTTNRLKTDIRSEFLLSSDIKGYIEDPGQYFDPTNENRQRHLDLLLMTQGWRRFTWNYLLTENKQQPEYPMQMGLDLSGTARYNKKNNPAVTRGTVTFMDLSQGMEAASIVQTDKEGRFSFPGLFFDEQSAAMLKAADTKGRENIELLLDHVSLDSLPVENRSTDFLYYRFLTASGDSSQQPETEVPILMSGQYTDLGAVVVEGNRGSEVKAKQIPKSEMGGRVFDVEELTQNTSGARSVLDLLVGRLPGLSVIRFGSQPEDIKLADTRGNKGFSGLVAQEPIIMLDGQTIDLSIAANLQIDNIATLEVYMGPAAAMYGGIRGANGVISMTSKEGTDAWSGRPMEGALSLKGMGYAYAKAFYSPQYDVPDPDHDRRDERSLLYWTPNIITNQEGKATVSFFTGDLEGTYLIDLQGIGLNGKTAVNNIQRIRVSKK